MVVELLLVVVVVVVVELLLVVTLLPPHALTIASKVVRRAHITVKKWPY